MQVTFSDDGLIPYATVSILILFVLNYMFGWGVSIWLAQRRIRWHLRLEQARLISVTEDITPYGVIENRRIFYWRVVFIDRNGWRRQRLYTCGFFRFTYVNEE